MISLITHVARRSVISQVTHVAEQGELLNDLINLISN